MIVFGPLQAFMAGLIFNTCALHVMNMSLSGLDNKRQQHSTSPICQVVALGAVDLL